MSNGAGAKEKDAGIRHWKPIAILAGDNEAVHLLKEPH
jgi:hypothetical protein